MAVLSKPHVAGGIALAATLAELLYLHRKWRRHLCLDLVTYGDGVDATLDEAASDAATIKGDADQLMPDHHQRCPHGTSKGDAAPVPPLTNDSRASEHVPLDEAPSFAESATTDDVSGRDTPSAATSRASDVAVAVKCCPASPERSGTTKKQSKFMETFVRRVFDDRRNSDVWMPVFAHDLRVRGLMTRGLSFRTYLKMWLVMGRQYAGQMLCNIARYAMTGPRQQCPADLYAAVLNTSLSAYIDAETGNVVMHDLRLVRCRKYGRFVPEWLAGAPQPPRHIHRLVFELDHEQSVLTRAVADDVETVDMNEIASLVTLAISLRAHTHVHWWCNAVCDTKDLWSLAGKSGDMVQYLNYLAVFGACDFMGISKDDFADFLSVNVPSEGFPVHSVALRPYAARSRTHRMAHSARMGLMRLLGAERMPEIESILAATLLHSADHYYIGKYTEDHGHSSVLGGNNLLMRLTVVPPIRLYGGLLVRENLHDPVCRIIYDACRTVDPDFANTALFLGPAA